MMMNLPQISLVPQNPHLSLALVDATSPQLATLTPINTTSPSENNSPPDATLPEVANLSPRQRKPNTSGSLHLDT